MLTNIQQNFRFYLALVLSMLLAAGVRLQAAPLGEAPAATEQPAAPAGTQVAVVPPVLAVR